MTTTIIILSLIVGIPFVIHAFYWLKALPDLWHSFAIAKKIKHSPLLTSETLYYRCLPITIRIHEKGMIIQPFLSPSIGIAHEDITSIDFIEDTLIIRHHLLHVQYMSRVLFRLSMDSIRALQDSYNHNQLESIMKK